MYMGNVNYLVEVWEAFLIFRREKVRVAVEDSSWCVCCRVYCKCLRQYVRSRDENAMIIRIKHDM